MDAMKSILWFLVMVTKSDDVVSQNIQLEMQSKQHVSIGNSVVLTSRIITDQAHLNVTSVIWTKGMEGVIIMYSDNKIRPVKYIDRVNFLHSKPSRDVSIYINSTNLDDSAHYTCTVVTANPEAVKIGETNLSVLIPPSTPNCSISGSRFIGHNVTLSCHSTSGKPVPTYTWQQITPKLQSFTYPAHNPQIGSLLLKNLTKEMSGLYTCRSINLAGNASCSILMEVITSNNAGLIAGAIIGVVLGMCLLVAIIVFYCNYQRKSIAEKEEDLANEIKEDAQAPVGNVWLKNGSSDIISKNGTLSSVNSTMHAYKPYPVKPPSDTASTITAAGVSSTGSVKHPKNAPKPVNTHRSTPSPKWQNGAQLQTSKEQQTLPSITSSNLTRKGAVPVMVPAQSQVGSLV